MATMDFNMGQLGILRTEEILNDGKQNRKLERLGILKLGDIFIGFAKTADDLVYTLCGTKYFLNEKQYYIGVFISNKSELHGNFVIYKENENARNLIIEFMSDKDFEKTITNYKQRIIDIDDERIYNSVGLFLEPLITEDHMKKL